ncbi:unnamed protein product, partial [marine sediment metagenome]
MDLKYGRIFLILICFLMFTMPLYAKGSEETGTNPEIIFDPSKDYFPDKATLKHTGGFTVEYFNNYKVVTVLDPWPRSDLTFQYILVQRGTPVPEAYYDAQVIEVPVQSLVTMSTTYLPYIEMLGVLDTLVGHDAFQYINTPAVLKRIEEGKIKEVGYASDVNVELVLDIAPDLIMTHGYGNEWDAHPKLLEAGLKVALNGERSELSPLGRTEWIKFIALFFNKEKEAGRIFDSIVEEYNALLEKV